MRPDRERGQREDGAAVVDFVLVLVLLLPLVLGILQVAFVLHVRNTVASAMAEGARYAATWEATPQDGLAKAHEQYAGSVSPDLVGTPRVELVELEGLPAYRMTSEVRVPALGLGGPAITFEVSGNAVIEPDPRGPARPGGQPPETPSDPRDPSDPSDPNDPRGNGPRDGRGGGRP